MICSWSSDETDASFEVVGEMTGISWVRVLKAVWLEVSMEVIFGFEDAK